MRVVLLLLLIIFSASGYALQEEEHLNLLTRSNVIIRDPGLNTHEWQWVREHKKMRLAVWLPMSPPYDITTGLTDYGGINADYIGLIADNIGIEIEVIRFASYDAAISALFAGKADFIAFASENEQKRGLILSDTYSVNQPVEVINNDTINHGVKQIAISPIYDRNSVLTRYPGATEVHFSSVRHALEALAFRKTDLFFCDAVTAHYLLSQSNLSNLSIRPVDPPFKTSGFAFAATEKMRIWINILNKLLQAVPKNESVEIHRRWNGGIPLSLSEKKPIYTSLEQKWIKEHEHIRVAVADDNEPITWFTSQGQLHGIIADILTALQIRTGFTFEIHHYPSLDEAMKSVKRGDNDLIAGSTQEGIWHANLLTTRTWLYNSWVMVGRAHQSYDHVTPRLVTVRSAAPENWLAHQNSAQIEQVTTWRQGLLNVVQNESDMMVMPLIVANSYLTHKEYSSLKILASIDTEPLRFALGASRNDWPLITILNKALINIPPEDLHALTRVKGTDNSFNVFPGEQDMNEKGIAFAIGGLVLLAIIGYIIHRQQRTIKALRKASHVKSTFLATMSHEIRTPVSIIIGMLELMMQPQKNSAQNQQFLRVSWDAAQSLLLLIGNILDVSRIESGRMVLRPERTTLRPLLLSTAMQFEGLAKQKALRFTLEIDAGLTDDVLIDAMRLRQIVLNLLGNAIKFTDKGDVIFRAQQEWRDRKNLMLKLEVEDTGSGIDDATRQRLFRPFAQGINSQVDQGSGLGLFICHTLTKMMNGEITVNSEQGKGTRVTVLLKLPLIASSSTMPILQREQSAPSLTLNVLIVDDNPAGRLLLAQQLTRLGHRVIDCGNAHEALARLNRQRVDVVISDCNMPGMDGYALAHRIRQTWPDIVLFGVTADARPSARDEAKKSGMDDCLFKPLSLAMLEELLAPLLLTKGHHPDSESEPADAFPVQGIETIPTPDLTLPDYLEGENLLTFLTLQIQVIDETLAALKHWQQEPTLPLHDALHKLRGGIQLLGIHELEVRCREQESHPDSKGICRLETDLLALRRALAQRTTKTEECPTDV